MGWRRHIANLIAPMALAAVPCLSQPTVAPSPEIAEPRGEDAGPYNITNSWEVGYRAHTVGGNEDKYRSDVNFGNGVRLLSSELTVHSRDGKAKLFDELILTTQGLGNDPYQFANLRFRKNRTFEYNFLWRSNDYFNPALTISDGQHLLDTTNRWQDHDLTLFPERRFKGLLGYSRNKREGPGLSTVNYFGPLGDEFPIFTDVRWQRNEYRAGGEIDLRTFRLRIIRAWENFKDDTPFESGVSIEGDDPADPVTLQTLRRDAPYHGNSPSWRGSLFAEAGRWLSVSARGTYTAADRDFVVDETATGRPPFGSTFDRQVIAFGTGSRPVATGNATISFFPTDRLTIANHTAFHNVRTEGDSTYREFSNRAQEFQEFSFQSLGIRTAVNTTDVNYRLRSWFGLYGGYHFSQRRIESREFVNTEGLEELIAAQQENTLQSGLFGVRLQPVKPLTVNLEGEVGRADRPFFPISEKNYHLLGGRVQYKTPTLLLSAATRIHYNTNSVSLSAHSSRSRNYAFDFSWTPSPRFAVDAGYNKMHVDTLSGIAYFAAFQPVEGERSLYISNIHAAHVGLRAVLSSRLDFYAGYSRVQDTGDGRDDPFSPEGDAGSVLPLFRAAQTFPVTFQSPLARLSVRIHPKIGLNLGYQYYGYAERFFTFQNYRAHTGYASVVWSF